jgi:prepilin-type N-terminal cleavage/methylation domain-containing protein
MHAPLNRLKTGQAGFTLIELAIVMIIMALLIGGMLLPISAQQDIRTTAETTRQMEEIKEALLGFTVKNGYFPCPAKSNSTSDGGLEDRNGTSGKCTKQKGFLPWITLGIKPTDGWGHLFIYSVTPAFSHALPADRFTLTTEPNITIQTRDASGNIVNLSNINDIPAVLVSTGRNGYLSWSLDQASQNADSQSLNTDEDTNGGPAADGKTFVSRARSEVESSGGEFDDLVVWIPPYVLFNRMIAAGKLP